MSAIVLEAVILACLILLNGVFALSEMALVSARKVRLLERANRGHSGARAALQLAESPNRFLSTVQIGITLVGVLAGAFGGATLSSVLADGFARVDALAPYSDALGFGVVVLIITYGSLVIGELVPKRIALQNPERVAELVARPMNGLAVLTAPVVRLLSASSNGVVRLLGVRPSDEPPITEEEIRILIRQGAQAGVIKPAEQDMVESVFRLDDRRVSAFMTPHTEIEWLDINDSVDVLRRKLAASPYSSLPVCRDELDNLLGVVRTRDLLAASLSGEPLSLEAHLRQPRFVPETVPVSRAVELIKGAADTVVVVIDEHGSIQGLITGHDILEAIVGDIPTSDEPYEPDVVTRSDGSLLLDGLMDIEDVCRLLKLDSLPGVERGHFHTLGGFIMSQAGAIPTEGECFRWGGYRFEVVDMDGHRVDKLLVARDPDAAAGESGGQGAGGESNAGTAGAVEDSG